MCFIVEQKKIRSLEIDKKIDKKAIGYWSIIKLNKLEEQYWLSIAVI